MTLASSASRLPSSVTIERVDLDERGVGGDEGACRAPCSSLTAWPICGALRGRCRRRSCAPGSALQADAGIDVLLEDQVAASSRRPPRCPCRRRSSPSAPGAAWRDRSACRSRARGRSAGPPRRARAPTFCPAGPVWWVTSCMPRIWRGDLLGLLGALHHLDAAALAAAAGVDLRLDDADAAAEPARDRAGLRGRRGHLAARNRHAELREDRLALILVNLHVGVDDGRERRRQSSACAGGASAPQGHGRDTMSSRPPPDDPPSGRLFHAGARPLVMSSLLRFLSSSVGTKILVALTGLGFAASW